MVDAEAIKFQGELKEWRRLADSGNTNAAKFCPGCGNRIYHFNPAEPATLKLKLKPVDLADASLFEPSAHVWTSEKLDWYQLPDGVKSFAEQP